MNEVIEIKRNEFVKYLKNLYLVKDFKRLDDRRYRLKYYFRTTKKSNSKLHVDYFQDINAFHAENVKKMTLKEAEIIISKIKNQSPDFDLSFVGFDKNKGVIDLDENRCVEYLKSKGYLVYKQI